MSKYRSRVVSSLTVQRGLDQELKQNRCKAERKKECIRVEHQKAFSSHHNASHASQHARHLEFPADNIENRKRQPTIAVPSKVKTRS